MGRKEFVLRMAQIYGPDRLADDEAAWEWFLRSVNKALDEYDASVKVEPKKSPLEILKDRMRSDGPVSEAYRKAEQAKDPEPDHSAVVENPLRRQREEALAKRIEAGEKINPHRHPGYDREGRAAGAMSEMWARLERERGGQSEQA